MAVGALRSGHLEERLVISAMLMIIGLQSLSLFGQAPAYTLQIGRDVWTFKDGAPEDIMSIAQTTDGFLWLASPTGLFRFDGLRFELFQSPFGDHPLSTQVTAVFAPPSGGVWIGYQFGGFSFIRNGKIENFTDLPSPSGTVWAFAQGSDGVVWAASTSGLWRFENQRWEHLGSERNLPPGSLNHLGFDRNGTLWVLGDHGPLLYLVRGSHLFRVAEESFKAEAPGEMSSYDFRLDADRRVVLRSLSKSKNTGHVSDSADGPSAYPVLTRGRTEIIDREGNLWSEHNGVLTVHPNPDSDQMTKRTAIQPEKFKLFPYGGARLVDREGNIWFGDQGGLQRFFHSPLVELHLHNAFGSFTLAPAADGEVWISAGNGAHLYHVVKERVTQQKVSRELAAFAYTAPDETIWLGGRGGLWKMANGVMAEVALTPEMTSQIPFLQSITQDSHGGIWLSFGRHGLFRLADGVWMSNGGRHDLPKTGVVILFTDPLGRVWFGYTKNQVAMLDGDRLTVLTAGEGLHVGNVTAFGGHGNTIWIGGEFGLQHYDQGRLQNIVALDDKLLRGISGIIETDGGDLWLNDLAGIVHIKRAELAEALKNTDYPIKGERFGRRDAGLPGLAPQLRPLPSAVEGTDGRLWFAESRGVVWLDPNQEKGRAKPAPVTIQSISAVDKTYETSMPIILPAHTDNVRINYAAVSLSDPEGIRFRYKLRRIDSDWHESNSTEPVTYRNLPPGSYHFSVAASDTNGAWQDKMADVDFTILPAFYQTDWFRACYAAAILLTLYLLYLFRLRQATAQIRTRMVARFDERERIARDLHDTLLQSIQGLILKFHAIATQIPVEQPLRDSMNTTLDHAEQVLAEGRDRVRDLRGATESLDNLPAAFQRVADETRSKQTIAFKTLIEGTVRELHPMVLDESYCIGREALVNAFIHSECRHVEVEIAYDSRQFRLRVRDDGGGIDADVLEEGRMGHWGLQGMRERADKVGGRLKIWSRRGGGTEVELSVPAATAYRPLRDTSFQVRTPAASAADKS